MNDKRKKVAVLGSTGSVGTQALDALKSLDVEYKLLTGGKNIKLLAEQARATKAAMCVVPDEKSASDLKLLLAGEKTVVSGGDGAIEEAVLACGADTVVHSISGMAGIPSAIAASKTGARLAIANKESIISLGDVIFENIKVNKGELIPVDSEHSAVFQCLVSSGAIDAKGYKYPEKIRRILLTASGGPFFGRKSCELENVTAEMALAHPTWKMGAKITIDCATLMNKGFEVIEACRLFGVDIEKIEVLVHRQSIVHSMVEFSDTQILAQLGSPDMRHCVRYALTYPERMTVNEKGIDLTEIGKLTFEKPDSEAFPLLDVAYSAYRIGTNAPAALIAADEVAVDAFMKGKIGFNKIADIVSETLARFVPSSECTVESVLNAEKEASAIASTIIG